MGALQMHSSELYARLGLDPRKHLPDGGIPPTDVDGIKVYVLARGQASPSRRQKGRYVGMLKPGGRRARMMKRTFAICPRCGRHVEAGHFFQHEETHAVAWQVSIHEYVEGVPRLISTTRYPTRREARAARRSLPLSHVGQYTSMVPLY